jgi:hypothetical protein
MKFFNAEISLYPASKCTGYGQTAEEAFSSLLSALRAGQAPSFGKPVEFFEEDVEDIVVYEPDVGKGYVVGVGDNLGRPIKMSGSNPALAGLIKAYLDGEVIAGSAGDDQHPLFVASISTHRTQSVGFGESAKEAVQVLLARWRLDYAPEADADEAYLAEIREDMSVFEVKVGGGYIDNPENPALARPLVMKGDDPRLDAVFDEYTQAAKPWQP